jgi:large subunit ribosomal protein L35
MKLKTRKSVAKRINKKKNIFARKKVNRGHLLRRKSSKRLRGLSQAAQVHCADLKSVALMLPYSL